MSHAICFLSGYLLHTLFVLDTPNMTGSHQAADCLSAPWESHPRPFFVDRPRITEVSLAPALSSPTRMQSELFYRLYRSSFRNHGAPIIWLNLSVMQVNVPDECVLNCQCSWLEIYLSLSITGSNKKSTTAEIFFDFFQSFIFSAL